jgi:hypothetical protein
MASQSWGQMLASIPAAGTLYNTYTTAKSILSSTPVTEASSGLVQLPSGFFKRGSCMEIDLDFGLSNIVTTPGTFTIQVMLGSIIVFTTGAVALTTTANTLAPVKCKISLTVRQEGVTTNALMMGQAWLQGINIAQTSGLANNAAGTGNTMAPQTAPAVGTGFDSTVANTLDIWAGFSISNAGNGIQLQQYRAISWGNTAV